ncbi:MAG: hypothetical protein AAFU77_18075 [Myxococcota bacterium]
MSETLQFIVMIDPMPSRESTIDALCAALPNARRDKLHSFEYSGNFFELWANPDHDSMMTSDPFDGFFYFEGRLEGTPTRPTDEDHQIAVAREVLRVLEQQRVRAVLCANFEDKL